MSLFDSFNYILIKEDIRLLEFLVSHVSQILMDAHQDLTMPLFGNHTLLKGVEITPIINKMFIKS